VAKEEPRKASLEEARTDQFGIGATTDGLAIFTPDEAKKLIAERDANEASDVFDIGDLDGLDTVFSKKP
jgi:hypothetical protein